MVDIRDTEREFQADLPPLEPLDMNMGAILSIDGTEATGGASVCKKSRNQQRGTRVHSGSWFRSWYASRDHSTHHAAGTTQTAPWLTNITDRKECRAPASFTIFVPDGERHGLGGRTNTSHPNWHGLLRERRMEGAMLAQRCVGRHQTSLGKSHLNLLTEE